MNEEFPKPLKRFWFIVERFHNLRRLRVEESVNKEYFPPVHGCNMEDNGKDFINAGWKCLRVTNS